jgi:hypothetical protein
MPKAERNSIKISEEVILDTLRKNAQQQRHPGLTRSLLLSYCADKVGVRAYNGEEKWLRQDGLDVTGFHKLVDTMIDQGKLVEVTGAEYLRDLDTARPWRVSSVAGVLLIRADYEGMFARRKVELDKQKRQAYVDENMARAQEIVIKRHRDEVCSVFGRLLKGGQVTD